jgi:hypothetical protein
MSPIQHLARRTELLAGLEPERSHQLLDAVSRSHITITPDQTSVSHQETIRVPHPRSSIVPPLMYELAIDIRHGQVVRASLSGDSLSEPIIAPPEGWQAQVLNGVIRIRNPHRVHLEMQQPGTDLGAMHTVHHAFQTTLTDTQHLVNANLQDLAAEISRRGSATMQGEFIPDYWPSDIGTPGSLEGRLARNGFVVFELGNGHPLFLIHRSGRDTGHPNGQWVVEDSGAPSAGVAAHAVPFGTIQEALSHIARRNSEHTGGQWVLSLSRPTSLLQMPPDAEGAYVADDGWVPKTHMSPDEQSWAGLTVTPPAVGLNNTSVSRASAPSVGSDRRPHEPRPQEGFLTFRLGDRATQRPGSNPHRRRDSSSAVNPGAQPSTSTQFLLPPVTRQSTLAPNGGDSSDSTNGWGVVRRDVLSESARRKVIERAQLRLVQDPQAQHTVPWLLETGYPGARLPQMTPEQQKEVIAWAKKAGLSYKSSANASNKSRALRFLWFVKSGRANLKDEIQNGTLRLAAQAAFASGEPRSISSAVKETFGLILETTVTGRKIRNQTQSTTA